MLEKMLFTLAIVLAVTSCADIRVGSYTKESFESNDLRINRAFQLVNQEILKNNGGPQNAEVIPVAVYSQIVNGINYKIVAAVRDNKKLQVNLVQSIVYSGPFSENFAMQKPSITFYEQVAHSNFSLTQINEQAIENAIRKSIGEGSVLEKIDSTESAAYPNLVYTEGFYVVKADILIGGDALSTQYFIISENYDGSFTVANQISFK